MTGPHDSLFKKALTHPQAAKEFLDTYLPLKIRKLVDTSTAKLEKDTFIDEDLKASYTDVLFSVKIDKQDGFIYTLAEHQSKPERFMSFRLLKYMVRILDHYKAQNPKATHLPLILPMIVYNGKQKYNIPTSIWELFLNPKIAKEVMAGDYELVDLTGVPDETFQKQHRIGMLGLFMKYAYERDVLKIFEKAKAIIRLIAGDDKNFDYIQLFLRYTSSRIDKKEKTKSIPLFT